jgi:hypothetical protein
MLFLTIELNLILWLILLGNAVANNGGAIWRDGVWVDGRIVIVGMILSVFSQHWAYRRARRQEKGQEKTALNGS